MLLCALAALAVAQNAYTPQQKFLANENVGNFACKIDTVSVEVDIPGDESMSTLTADDIEQYLSQTSTLEWAHVPQFFFASLDGRNDEKNLGTGGGDMGEFMQALHAYTKVTGVKLTADEVEELLSRYLKVMSRSKLFMETDEKSYRKLAIASGCQNLHIASLGEKRKKQAVLDAFESDDLAEFLGDPFLKFLASHTAELEFDRDYIVFALQAFHKILWRNSLESDKICYTMVKGRSDPKALVHVKTPGYCVDQGLAPLISSQMCAGQTFVEHTDAVKLFRRELVQLISRPGDNPQDVLAQFNVIAQDNLAKFWETYTGLPSFTVTFSHSSDLLKELVE